MNDPGNWQTPAAAVVVALTAAAFVIRTVRRRTRPGGRCAGGCDCPARPADAGAVGRPGRPHFRPPGNS